MSNAVNHILHPMHKNYLPSAAYPVYGYSAPAKSGVRIGVLVKYKATHDAPSVFFCVLASSHHFFSDMAIARVANKIMVGWMGAEQSAPVTLYAGYANPVQLTTSEIGVSGGGIKSQYKEAAICWLLPLPIIRNSFGLSPLFAAIVRQSNLFFTMLLLRLSVTLVALWCVITSVSSLDAFMCGRRAMIKTYDLPLDPAGHSANLISLALLMGEVLKGNADNRDEYLAALISLFEVYARDLHSLLEGHALPEVAQ
ncbi:ash family protein [Citrobacter portucalensis]